MVIIYDQCVTSSANFCKGGANIKSLRTTVLRLWLTYDLHHCTSKFFYQHEIFQKWCIFKQFCV